MNESRAVLAGTGICVPPLEVDNVMLSRIIETSDEWVRERSGVVTRYYVEPGVSSSDLGAAAARAALEDAGIEPGEVDYLVCATMTPDHYFPGTGTLIQQKLGIRPLPALDIRQQCAGFAYGLQMVDALIRSGIARTVLLVGADVHTSLMPFSARTFEVLHGRDPGPLSAEELRVELAVPAPAGAVRRRRRRHGVPGGGGERPRNPGRGSLRRRQSPGHPLRPRGRLAAASLRHLRDDPGR